MHAWNLNNFLIHNTQFDSPWLRPCGRVLPTDGRKSPAQFKHLDSIGQILPLTDTLLPANAITRVFSESRHVAQIYLLSSVYTPVKNKNAKKGRNQHQWLQKHAPDPRPHSSRYRICTAAKWNASMIPPIGISPCRISNLTRVHYFGHVYTRSCSLPWSGCV